MPPTPAPIAMAQPPAPPVPRLGAWAWPLVLSIAFALGVALWLEATDRRELEDDQRTLITDALTLQARLSDTLAEEQAALQRLADALPAGADEAALLHQGALTEGLQRLWISVTVLDGANRVTAHVPHSEPRTGVAAAAPRGGSTSSTGLSAHLSAPLHGGRLVARIAPTALLHQAVPWWLERRYSIRLVDGFGQVIARAADGQPGAPPAAAVAQGLSHRVSLEPALPDAWLDITVRDARRPWWRTLPLAWLGAFLVLSAAATWALRRRLQQTLQAEARWRHEAAWRGAIEHSLTVGLRGRDLDGRLVHVNRAFCDLVGFAPEELLGRLPPMPYWHPDEMADGMARHRRNMAGGAPREGYETRWRHRDGHDIDVMIFEAPLVEATGQQVGWMGSIVDLTARRRAEERERHHTELLANQARLTMLGEVASALAHQLNQPLAAIGAYTAGIEQGLAEGASPARLQQAARQLGEQAAEAGRIVQRIRAFVTRRAPQPEPCELAPLVQRVLALLRRELSSVAVQVHVPATLPRVAADAVLIEQVLINLLRNALDEFRAHAVAAPHLRVQAQPVAAEGPVGARFVRVDVEDNGPGLGGRGIDTLTAAFHSTKAQGMGMGLAICRSVVEAHHGAMEAGASDLGGARLSFTLPVQQEVIQ